MRWVPLFLLSLLFVVAPLRPAAAEPPAKADPPKKQVETSVVRTVALVLEPFGRADANRVSQFTNLVVAAFDKRKISRTRLIGPYDPMALGRGRLALKEARKALAGDHAMQRWADHEAKLTQALLGLKSGLGTATVDELVEVYVGLASTRLADGAKRFAEQYMVSALNLNPALEERDFFGRDGLKALYREVRSSVRMRPVGSVRVATKPAGAEVYVGDVLKGYSPLTLDTVKTGTQLVRVRKDGYYTHGWLADVREGGKAELGHDFRPIGGKAKLESYIKTLHDKRAWKRSPEKIEAAAEGIKRLLRCTDVVVARVKRTKSAYVLKGAVAPHDKEAALLDLTVEVNAELLKRVDVLTFEWVP